MCDHTGMAHNTEIKMATVEQILSAVGGKVSRDGQSVVVSYGNDGYARLVPDYVIVDGEYHGNMSSSKLDKALKALGKAPVGADAEPEE